jgi:hypothetical protein
MTRKWYDENINLEEVKCWIWTVNPSTPPTIVALHEGGLVDLCRKMCIPEHLLRERKMKHRISSQHYFFKEQ